MEGTSSVKATEYAFGEEGRLHIEHVNPGEEAVVTTSLEMFSVRTAALKDDVNGIDHIDVFLKIGAIVTSSDCKRLIEGIVPASGDIASGRTG